MHFGRVARALPRRNSISLESKPGAVLNVYGSDEALSLKRRKRKKKRTKIGINLVIVLLGGYLECEYTQ